MSEYALPSVWVFKRYNKDLADGEMPEMIQAGQAGLAL